MLDPLNGENSIKGFALLRPYGRIVHYGASTITNENRSIVNAFKTWWKCLSVNSLGIISENKSVSGYHLGCLLTNPAAAKKTMSDVATLMDLYEQGKIRIKIDSTYPYSKVGEAMKRMHTRQNVGKIILKPDSEWTEPAPAETTMTTPVPQTPTTSANVDDVQVLTEKLAQTELSPAPVVVQETPKFAAEPTPETTTTTEAVKEVPETPVQVAAEVITETPLKEQEEEIVKKVEEAKKEEVDEEKVTEEKPIETPVPTQTETFATEPATTTSDETTTTTTNTQAVTTGEEIEKPMAPLTTESNTNENAIQAPIESA